MGGGSWIEGRRAVVEALEVGMPLKRALVADSDGSLADIVRQLEEAGVPIERSSRSKLDAISSHGAHQGVVVQAAPFRYADLSDVIERAGEGDALVVLLDHVTDQGNLGAIIRTAEVVGATGVVIPSARAAGVGVGAYKTSAGAVLHLPVAQVPNLARAIEALKEAGFWACAATEHATDDVWHAPMGGRLALVMGSEGEGISRLVRETCDFSCRLPQRGRIESLNVAQATTVMCYEWLRRVSEAEEAAAAADAADMAGE
jgi:23S rRNA (guanosine2251-2'-O)-methyltransferase